MSFGRSTVISLGLFALIAILVNWGPIAVTFVIYGTFTVRITRALLGPALGRLSLMGAVIIVAGFNAVPDEYGLLTTVVLVLVGLSMLVGPIIYMLIRGPEKRVPTT